MKEIAKKHGKSVAQVLIRYHIDKGRTVIPKSAKKERLQVPALGDIPISILCL